MIAKEYITKLGSISKKLKEFSDFLLLNGKAFKINHKEIKELLEEYRIVLKEKGCYPNTQVLTILSNGKYKYCEGYGVLKSGIPLEHAWNLLEGDVVDISWNDGIEYFGIEMPYEFVERKYFENGIKEGLTKPLIVSWFIEQKGEKLAEVFRWR